MCVAMHKQRRLQKWSCSGSMCSKWTSSTAKIVVTPITTTRHNKPVSGPVIGIRSITTAISSTFALVLLLSTSVIEVHAASEQYNITTPMTPQRQFRETDEVHSTNHTSGRGKWFSHLSTGNDLWDGIIRDCYHRPSFTCFQKNVYTFLDGTLETSDVNVTSGIRLFKNQVDYAKYTVAANELPQDDDDGDTNEDTDDHVVNNEIPNESRAVETPIEEVTSALYGKSVQFVMTHDVELKLPEIVFDGATFRISPRSIEGNGAIVKLELIPKAEIEARETGKLFIKKKIQKFLRSKVVLSFLALILILKIVKIKIFWLLPLIVGVGTAKKLLLKFLLFLFPALSHLFKLCSYYQQEYHSTKFHHHHHLINHHHTIVPAWHSEGPPRHVLHGPHPPVHGPELIYTDPPKVPPSVLFHGGGPTRDDYGSNDWVNSGPGLGSEYISDINRSAQVDGNYFKPRPDDTHELHSWGLGTTSEPSQQQQQRPPPQFTSQNPNTHPFITDPQSYIQGKVRLQGPVYVPQRSSDVGHQSAAPTAAQIAAQYDPNRNKQLTPELTAQMKEALRIEAEKRLISQQQQILEKQPFVQGGPPLMPKNYDPFYTPIIEKIDKILGTLGFVDDHCKERLVCSMYKNPMRFSPHSNFLSAELSRDTSELETPDPTNPTVVRFFRLVDAARNGQEQRDCIHLYAQCSVNTEL